MILPITCPSCGEENEAELECESTSNGDGVWAESGYCWIMVALDACCVDMDFETLRDRVEAAALREGPYVPEPIFSY